MVNGQAANGVHRIFRWKYRLLLGAGVAAVVIFGWNYVRAGRSNDLVSYQFATVRRSDLKLSTLATGRLKAVDAVQVSSQLSGQVVKLDADFNDKVKVGSPLAQLDDETFKAAVAEAQARVAHGKAAYDAALAKTAGAKARYESAKANYQRITALKKPAAFSALEIDKARADMVAAESQLNAARADKAVQQAAIQEAKAALRRAQINLSRTVIRSPIAGTVIKRAVELGQTVAVSMQAPTLFTIARDLHQMRVHITVDEADIGRIRVGQHVWFSVDAYPNRRFTGHVIDIHRAPKIMQNVVTYTVVATAENHDLVLLPGMTAIVHIVTTDHRHVLLIPSAALHFQPEAEGSNTSGQARSPNNARARVWIRTRSGKLSPADIHVGKSNGSMTEVISGPLSAGEAVAVGKRFRRREQRLFGIRLGF